MTDIFIQLFETNPYSLIYNLADNHRSKHRVLHSYFTNVFFNNAMKNETLDAFCIAQRRYFALVRFIRIYRIRTAKATIQTDLTLNPIDTNHKNSIMVHQNNTNYWFVLSDLMTHIEIALTNSPNFFPEPIPIKNPYTNIPFTKSALYAVWFQLRASTYRMPSLFQHYVLCDFDIHMFRIRCEMEIRERFVRRFVYRADEDELFAELEELFIACGKDFDPNIPKAPLIQIMRPYLYLYLIGNVLALGLEKRARALLQLKRRMRELYKFNPAFGRFMILKKKEVYELSHPKFQMCDIQL